MGLKILYTPEQEAQINKQNESKKLGEIAFDAVAQIIKDNKLICTHKEMLDAITKKKA